MNNPGAREPASESEDPVRFSMKKANASDVKGLVALHEPDNVLALQDGKLAIGHLAIREFYPQLMSEHCKFQEGEQHPAQRRGVLALTSSRLASSIVTVEGAREQEDGSWSWTIDQPAISK